MKKLLILLSVGTFFLLGCEKYQQEAGSVGSGAGIQKEEVYQQDPETGEVEKVERMDAGGDDMNITTPIYDADTPKEELERD